MAARSQAPSTLCNVFRQRRVMRWPRGLRPRPSTELKRVVLERLSTPPNPLRLDTTETLAGWPPRGFPSPAMLLIDHHATGTGAATVEGV